MSTITERENEAPRSLQSLPPEIIIGITAVVGSRSLADLANMKLSCKQFNPLSDGKEIYSRACLKGVNVVYPADFGQKKFVDKCRESGNPEVFFGIALHQALHSGYNQEIALFNFDEAVKYGMPEGAYAKAIFLLYSGDEEQKRRGVEAIQAIKKMEGGRGIINAGRFKVRDALMMLICIHERWTQLPICCKKGCLRSFEYRWTTDFDDNGCADCDADREANFIYFFDM